MAVVVVGYPGEFFGCGEGDFLFVDGVQEVVGPFDHVQAVEDPGDGTASVVCHAVDAVRVEGDQVGELLGLFNGGKGAAVGVFGQAKRAGAQVVDVEDDGGDLGAGEPAVGGETVASSDQG